MSPSPAADPIHLHGAERPTDESHPPSGHSDSGSQKRKWNPSEANLDAGGQKPVKRRAAKACAACRSRKVRCDWTQRFHVTADGKVTCSNCAMDSIKCVIEESRRRK